MPFLSKKQMKACYASKGFNGKVDCDEWKKKTNLKKLPENNLPFRQKEKDGFIIRTFSKNLNENELKWHKDLEDRIIIPLNKNDWKSQKDNELPQNIDCKIKIKANEWHRIIKGTGNLSLKIIKVNDERI